MNDMENMTTEQRIARFRDLMGAFVPKEFTTHLIDHGFFIVPASIHHHGACAGALFAHSLTVTEALVDLTEKLNLKWELERSPYVVGMFHDLCKIDNYQQEPGCGEAWEYNNSPILTGHGDKSVIMLQNWITLSMEEIACIRWHMGAFDDKANWNSYGGAVTAYPNVLYTHTADMIAARIVGV